MLFGGFVGSVATHELRTELCRHGTSRLLRALGSCGCQVPRDSISVYPSRRILRSILGCYVGASGDLHGLFALLGEAKLRPLRAVGASSQAGREFSDVMNT